MSSNYTSFFADTVESKFGVELDIQYPLCPSRFVLFGLILYISSIIMLQPAPKDKSSKSNSISSTSQGIKKKKQRTFGTIEKIIFIHNLILAIFSAVCFINTVPIVYQSFAAKGYSQFVCDFHTLYDPEVSTFGYWSYLFYLSKYYEFIDTWIVIARGRRPIFLQEYHHVGAVIAMWSITVTKSAGGYVFVIENSFIHTIMYTYYASSVIGYRFPLKNLITMAQIFQFVNGLMLVVYQFYAFPCLSIGDRICHIYHLLYVGYLFVLFVQFYRRTYNKKRVSKKKET